MGRLIDLSGKRFGRLLAIERDTSRPGETVKLDDIIGGAK